MAIFGLFLALLAGIITAVAFGMSIAVLVGLTTATIDYWKDSKKV